MKIVEQVLKGDKRAAGKLISMIEDDDGRELTIWCGDWATSLRC